MMECFKCFTDGYQRISVLAKKDDDMYEDVKQDLDDVVLRWKELEKETGDKVIEISEYFKTYLENEEENEEEVVIKRAEEFGKVMKEYSDKIYEIDATLDYDPKRIDARIELLKERIQKIEVHGLRLGIACIALLAFLGCGTAWQIYGVKPVKIVLGGAVGLACGILVFLITYHVVLALGRSHLSKWEELNKSVKDFPEIEKEIKQKRPIARDIAELLTGGMEKGSIQYAAEDINKRCEEFLAN